MGPDLKLHNVDSMSFHSELVMQDEHISMIRKISPPDKDGDSLFSEHYDGHFAWVWTTRPRKQRTGDGQRVDVHFNYMTGGRTKTKGIPKISELVNILASIGQELEFNCRIIFQFRKGLKPKTIITLPIRYTESPFMPFDTIEGLRLAKMEGKKRKHDIILEAIPGGAIRASLYFDHVSKFSDSLPEEILQQGIEIVDKFVSRR